jgi:hypothetical protein
VRLGIATWHAQHTLMGTGRFPHFLEQLIATLTDAKEPALGTDVL